MAFVTSDPNTSHVLGTPVVIVEVQDEQNADFTATAGQNGACHEWPVDMSAFPAGGILNVTAPAAPAVGDCFGVFDSTLSCDNGIDPPGLNRNISINFAAEPVMSQAAPEVAVINLAGARIGFLYVGGTVGWRIASDVNA